MNYKVRPLDGADPHPRVPPYKFLGRTPLFAEHLSTRAHLQESLFCVYPLHRRMFRLCITDLPDRVLDYSRLKGKILPVPVIMQTIYEQIHQGHSLVNQFYGRMAKLCDADKTVLPRGVRRKYWSTASALFSEHLSTLLRNSCDYLIDQVDGGGDTPLVLLTLVYNGRFCIDPPLERLRELVLDAEEAIRRIGANLETFESRMLKLRNKTWLRIHIGEEYVAQLAAKLDRNMETTLSSVVDYVDELHQRFGPIVREQELHQERPVSDLGFEEGFRKITYFQTFVSACMSMLGSEHFAMHVLAQDECKMALKAAIETLENNIAGALLRQHEWENRDVCEAFQMLATRAKQYPQTTEELIEMGESLFTYFLSKA